ncbi:MAG: hypothetical protein J0L69_10070 [Bacteroidetes bacterium]|nr:hypothetical protein [Bacteroidota bacterium]
MRLVKAILLLLLFNGLLNAQINVKARIDHVKPDGVDTQGNIYLTVTGGTSPYTYLWSPGGSTNKDLTNATANSYTVRVKGANNDSVFYKYNLGYKTYWTNFTASFFRNDTLHYVSTPSHSVTSGYWCTAVSKNTLKSDQNGWTQWVINSSTSVVAGGFADSISVARTGIYTDIDFGFYQQSGTLYRIHYGVLYSLSTCTAGDVLRLERNGSTMYFKKNDVVLTSYTIAINSKDWKIKSATYGTYNANIGASFLDTTKTMFPNYVEDVPLITHATPGSSNGSIKLNPRITGTSHNYTWTPGGASTNSLTSLSASAYSVQIMDVDSNRSNYVYNIGNKTYWTNFFGTRFRNDSLQFQTPTSPTGWNSALSKNTLKAGTNGWIEIVAKLQTEIYMLGFLDSVTAVPGVYTDLDNYVYIHNNIIRSNGSTIIGSYRSGDIIRLERNASTFYIKVNGLTIHSEACSTNRDWKVKAMLYNAAICNIGASFIDTSNVNFPNYALTVPLIKHCSPGLSNGSIALSPRISGSTQSYTWQPGGATTNSITSLSNGNYSVTAQDANNNASSFNFNVGYKTYWTNFYGTKVSNDSLTTKAPLSPSGYNTAISKNTLRAGNNGWIEYVITSASNLNKIGFIDSVAHMVGLWEDMDFGFNFVNNYLYRYTSSGSALIGGYSIGDVVRLERVGSTINYKLNGVTLSTATCTTARDWKVKAAVYSGTMNNIGCSFYDSTNVNMPGIVLFNPVITNSSGYFVSDGKFTFNSYNQGSALTYSVNPGNYTGAAIQNVSKDNYTITAVDANNNSSTYVHPMGYKVYWSNFYSTISRNDSILNSTPPIGSWGSLVSKNSLIPNVNARAHYVVGTVSNNSHVLGFLDSAYLPASYTDIDYGVYQASQQLYYCSGTSLVAFWYCRVGDIVSIERNGNVFSCRINGIVRYSTTISAGLLTKKWWLKAAKHNSTPYFANIGCSFPSDFNAAVEKNHADADNLNNGSISVTPYGGTKPFTYQWNDDDNSNSKNNLSPGTYTVVISDSLGKEKVGKVINIGVKPNWKVRKNIRVTSDSTYIINADSLGRLISENYIRKNDKGWHEVTVNSITQDMAIGLIGLPPSYLDTTVTPPIYADSSMNRKSDLAYALIRKATKDSLVYSVDNNLLQLSTDYNYVHLARIKNGQVRPLFRNTPISAVYSYAVGDVLKVGRDENGKMFLARNDTVLYKQNASNYDPYLYSALVAKTNPKSGKNGVSNPIPIIPFPTCVNDNTLNWASSREFDEYGNVVSESRQYFDNFGRSTQQQVKIITDNNVLASESLYDSYGRAIGATLPAPLYSTYNCYAPTFFSNSSGTHYSLDDFDKPKTNSKAVGETYNPSLVGKTLQGTLGWYYSDNNSSEPLIASDSFPYNRLEYSNDPLNRVVKTGGVGRHHKMGSGHEGIIIYTKSGQDLKSVYPKETYELDENFITKNYPSIGIAKNITDARKTIQINPDGHDQITYTTDEGKILATCVTGYDANCPSKSVNTDLSRESYALLHITKQENTTLKITEITGSAGITISNMSFLLRNYNTKQALILNTDYSLNIVSNVCSVTFLGDYANRDLFLEIAYKFNTGYTPVSNYNYRFFTTHNLGYTQWTVYYYDVKGRLKAIQSPNDVVCGQNLVSSKTRQDTSDLAFPCDSGIVGNISLENLSDDPADPIYAQDISIELEPQFNLFNQFVSYSGGNNWRFQTNDTLASRDTMFNYPPYYKTPDSTIVFQDTAFRPRYFAVDSVLVQNYEYHRNDILSRLQGKRVTYEGKYQYSILNGSGNSVTHTAFTRDFNFTLSFDTVGNGKFVNNLPGRGYAMFVPDSLLDGASNIIFKCTNLKIRLDGFSDSPVRAFSPCDKQLYVCPSDTELLTNINANVSLIAKAIIGTTPPPSSPVTPTYSRKYSYNEYDHLITYETKDEGRTDYVYDLKEDKLKFSQNDKQRADGNDFVYYSYDKLGRPTESGLYDPTSNSYVKFQNYNDWKNNVSVSPAIQSTGYYAQNDFNLIVSSEQKEQNYVEYDFPAAGMPLTSFGYTQKYLGGNVSRTYNSNSSTYYSYNELGRVTTVIQDLAGLGGKSMEYSYDLRGKLIYSIYQRNNSTETFAHAYTYDSDQRLKKAYIARNTSMPSNPVVENNYYKHGSLKRSVLGNNLQGLDYVYTINGLLKAVNNPFSGGDPGNDGSNGVSADIFSYAMEYYPKDYERAYSLYNSNKNTGTYSNFNVSYTGIANAIRWRNVYPSGAPAPSPSALSGPFMYEYDYDELYRLKGATFGNYSVVNPGNGYLTDVAFNPTSAFKLQDIAYDRNGNLQNLKRYSNTANVLMDEFTYHYDNNKRNRLARVNDAVTTSLGLGADIDFPNQTNANNYSYDAIGQPINNIQDDQVYTYNSQGLVTSVKKYSNNNLIAEFSYNDRGMRHSKTSYNSSGTAISRLYYVYDEAGSLIATYNQNLTVGGNPISIQDFAIYGGGRLGVYDAAGNKPYFELTDHLGNVRSVFTDNSGVASAVSYTDYYPHGGVMPGRNYVNSPAYRYNYQGQEKDAETNLVNFKLRQMDVRLGRWLSIDPFGQYNSPYLAMGNNPLDFSDKDGGWSRSVNYNITSYLPSNTFGFNEGTYAFDDMSSNSFITNAVENFAPYVWDAKKVPFEEVGLWMQSIGEKSSKITGYYGKTIDGRTYNISLNDAFAHMENKGTTSKLSKELLMEFLKENNMCPECGTSKGKWEAFAGNYFEKSFVMANKHLIATNDLQPYKGNSLPTLSSRRVMPDYTMSSSYQRGISTNGSSFDVIKMPKSVFVEVKATKNNIYTSSFTGQVKGHIEALKLSQSGNMQRFPNFHPQLILVTTSGVDVSRDIIHNAHGINVVQYESYFKVVDGKINIFFNVKNNE